MNTSGISYRHHDGDLYVKVEGWPFGAARHANAYVCSCNVCGDYSKAGWVGTLGDRIHSRYQDRNGVKKGRVLYLVDYSLNGFRPLAALCYHVTKSSVLQVLAAGISESALTADTDRLIANLLNCADAIAFKSGLKARIEWLCIDEEQADDICDIHGFSSGRRLQHGQVIVRRPLEND
jgi:hypothetical protein